MAGCIGPFYNPYPISKLVAKVGPPLKLNTMSVEEQINAEIQAEAKTESSDEISQNSNDDNGASVKASNDLVYQANDLYSETKKTQKMISSLSTFAVTYKDGVPTKTDEEIVKVEGDIQKQVETIPEKVNKANELREKVVNKNVT